jgi:hypothetical protein
MDHRVKPGGDAVGSLWSILCVEFESTDQSDAPQDESKIYAAALRGISVPLQQPLQPRHVRHSDQWMLNRSQTIAIALFSCLVMGIAWFDRASSEHPPQEHAISSAQTSAHANTAQNQPPKPLRQRLSIIWQRTWTDPVAFYTFVLSIFTGLLAVVSATQIIFLIRTDKITRITAEAAQKSADHIPRVERAYLSGGGAPSNLQPIDPQNIRAGIRHMNFMLDINNYGKTPGELLEFGIGWCEFDEVAQLPTRPNYRWFFFRDFIRPDTSSRHLVEIGIPENARIDPVIYGRYGYQDIFGAKHSDGFIQRGGTPIIPPHSSYTESDPSWDLPYVGDRRHRRYGNEGNQG